MRLSVVNGLMAGLSKVACKKLLVIRGNGFLVNYLSQSLHTLRPVTLDHTYTVSFSSLLVKIQSIANFFPLSFMIFQVQNSSRCLYPAPDWCAVDCSPCR